MKPHPLVSKLFSCARQVWAIAEQIEDLQHGPQLHPDLTNEQLILYAETIGNVLEDLACPVIEQADRIALDALAARFNSSDL